MWKGYYNLVIRNLIKGEVILLKVKKRDGRIQTFNLEKIKLSIQNASDDMRMPLNESDVYSIIQAINTKIFKKGQDIIECNEIHGDVILTLKEFGFNKLAKFYDEGKKLVGN